MGFRRQVSGAVDRHALPCFCPVRLRFPARRFAPIVGALALLAVLPQAAADEADAGPITALGRLEPRDGVIRVAGPSRFVVVIADLLVEEGDVVKQGQPLAVLDTYALHKAEVERLAAQLENAERELARISELHESGVSSDQARDGADVEARMARAALARARADFDLSLVRSPIDGEVLEIHAREGERVGSDGIVELGRTQEMYAIAEVYETDIGRVRVDQRATIRSRALPEPLYGRVERIGRKVGKLDVLSTDPAARTDARVVEVEIALDDGAAVRGLTNLQVEVEVAP
jgi:HlyD family secretion protein